MKKTKKVVFPKELFVTMDEEWPIASTTLNQDLQLVDQAHYVLKAVGRVTSTIAWKEV